MSKRLCACLLLFLLLFSLAACNRSDSGQEVLTRGKDFDEWWNLYGKPYYTTFGIHKNSAFDSVSHELNDDAHLDHSFYYLAYHTLLAEGVALEGFESEREDWEGDPETYLEYHMVPADLMAETMTRILGLTDAQQAELPGENNPYVSDTGSYIMQPPYNYDSETGKLGPDDDIPLVEVRIDHDASPRVAQLLLLEADPSVPDVSLACRVTYIETDTGWRLAASETFWEENDLVKITGGQPLDSLSGLGAADCTARFRSALSTPDGILLLLFNNTISGYDLIHVDSTGKVLATGQLPDALSDTYHVAMNLYDGETLIITTGQTAFVGDLSLAHFLTYELTYWSWGGTPDSAVLLPDLTTWYYTGRDGIYQYNSETGEHVPFDTHPVPIRDDDHGMSAQVYRSLYLAGDGSRLIASVVGYEWISNIHVFDLTPGSIMTKAALECGWGYSGSGYAGNDYFIYHDASEFDEATQTFRAFSGGYHYTTGMHTPLNSNDMQNYGSTEGGLVTGNHSGDTFAFVGIEGTEGTAEAAYPLLKGHMADGHVEQAASVTATHPRILGIFPDGQILACYDGYGHSGFIIA